MLGGKRTGSLPRVGRVIAMPAPPGLFPQARNFACTMSLGALMFVCEIEMSGVMWLGSSKSIWIWILVDFVTSAAAASGDCYVRCREAI